MTHKSKKNVPCSCGTVLLCFYLICVLLTTALAGSENDVPKLTSLPGNVFSDFKIYAKETLRTENLPVIGAVVASTAILIYYDQKLVDSAQKLGRNLGLGNKDGTETYIRIKNLSIFRGPSDFGSTLYFLGDGWLHSSIAASFYCYGLSKKNTRAIKTGYALMEGLGTIGIASQVIKHITGRESPSVATSERGVWRFFPSPAEYNKRIPAYDAYPSGHLATALMTTTVISANYPEYRLVRPIGYGLMTLLAFQMMNNGSHWASDYPIALAMGYGFGKIAVKRANGEYAQDKEKKTGFNYRIFPSLDTNVPGIILLARY
jgi:hypothetical protein